MIEFKNLVKNYQTGEIVTKVLKRLNFKINEGEFVAIMGPSGSGKTTLMNIIGMLDVPTSGKYLFFDKDVAKLSDDDLAEIRLKHLGFVFQTFNLLKRTSVLRNVMLPFVYTGIPSSLVEREKRARKALREVGLNDEKIWTHLSNQISGGQMQRVAIARALVNNPKLILADEPTGNLDSQTGEVVMDTFEKLHQDKGRSIILITHEMEVAEFADRIIVVKDGIITEDYKNTKKRTVKNGLNL